MIAPPLEPGKRYPVFFEHYGGPTGQEVTNSLDDRRSDEALVGKGYIIFYYR